MTSSVFFLFFFDSFECFILVMLYIFGKSSKVQLNMLNYVCLSLNDTVFVQMILLGNNLMQNIVGGLLDEFV